MYLATNSMARKFCKFEYQMTLFFSYAKWFWCCKKKNDENIFYVQFLMMTFRKNIKSQRVLAADSGWLPVCCYTYIYYYYMLVFFAAAVDDNEVDYIYNEYTVVVVVLNILVYVFVIRWIFFALLLFYYLKLKNLIIKKKNVDSIFFFVVVVVVRFQIFKINFKMQNPTILLIFRLFCK